LSFQSDFQLNLVPNVLKDRTFGLSVSVFHLKYTTQIISIQLNYISVTHLWKTTAFSILLKEIICWPDLSPLLGVFAF